MYREVVEESDCHWHVNSDENSHTLWLHKLKWYESLKYQRMFEAHTDSSYRKADILLYSEGQVILLFSVVCYLNEMGFRNKQGRRET